MLAKFQKSRIEPEISVKEGKIKGTAEFTDEFRLLDWHRSQTV